MDYTVDEANQHMSFLELLDVLNESLIERGEEPVEFDNDCREGICGSCGIMVGGTAHGPEKLTAVCQLHMRSFNDGDEIVVEPWRAAAFPIIKDLVVDRSAFDRIIAAGGFISTSTGGSPDANAILIRKSDADHSMDFAACIGCGACVAACPNSSASLFTAAKIAHLELLPQGEVESVGPRAQHDRPNGKRRLWRLFQPCRVRSRVSKGHFRVRHCPHAPDLHEDPATEIAAYIFRARNPSFFVDVLL